MIDTYRDNLLHILREIRYIERENSRLDPQNDYNRLLVNLSQIDKLYSQMKKNLYELKNSNECNSTETDMNRVYGICNWFENIISYRQ